MNVFLKYGNQKPLRITFRVFLKEQISPRDKNFAHEKKKELDLQSQEVKEA
jgi:hypothetical protein